MPRPYIHGRESDDGVHQIGQGKEEIVVLINPSHSGTHPKVEEKGLPNQVDVIFRCLSSSIFHCYSFFSFHCLMVFLNSRYGQEITIYFE